MSTALAAAVQEKAGTVVPALMPFIRPEMAGLTPIAPPRHIVGAPRFLQVGAGRKVAGQNASAVCGQLRFAQLLICQLHHGQRCFNMRAANARLRRWRHGKGAGLRRFGFAKLPCQKQLLPYGRLFVAEKKCTLCRLICRKYKKTLL